MKNFCIKNYYQCFNIFENCLVCVLCFLRNNSENYNYDDKIL